MTDALKLATFKLQHAKLQRTSAVSVTFQGFPQTIINSKEKLEND